MPKAGCDKCYRLNGSTSLYPPTPPLGRAKLPPCRLISGVSAVSPDWWSIWIKNELYSQLASNDSCPPLPSLKKPFHVHLRYARRSPSYSTCPRSEKGKKGLWIMKHPTPLFLHAVIRCGIGSTKPHPHRRTPDNGKTSLLIKLTRVLTMLILPSPSRRTL